MSLIFWKNNILCKHQFNPMLKSVFNKPYLPSLIIYLNNNKLSSQSIFLLAFINRRKIYALQNWAQFIRIGYRSTTKPL